jgi:hypothetical protein
VALVSHTDNTAQNADPRSVVLYGRSVGQAALGAGIRDGVARAGTATIGHVLGLVEVHPPRISDSLEKVFPIGHRIEEVGRQYLCLTAGGGRAGGRAPCEDCA